MCAARLSRSRRHLAGAGRKTGPFALVMFIAGLMNVMGCGENRPIEAEPSSSTPSPPASAERPGQRRLQLSENYAFSADAIRFYGTQSGNWIFSPLGPLELGAALAHGAREKTQEELRAAFHLRADKLSRTFVPADSVECEIATSMWISPDAKILADYVKDVQKEFDAELGNNYEAQAINDWVSDRTRGHVPQLIDHELNPQSRMVLANALYFHGRWTEPFEENATKPLPFHISSETVINVPTMIRTGEFRYSETETYQLLVMDYQGGTFLYACLLPREGLWLADLLAGWTEEELTGLIASANGRKVEVYLPKYKTRMRGSVIPFLLHQKIATSFDQMAANFSGISSDPIHISEFLQESTFDLDEKGTVATSATYVELLRSIGYVSDTERIPVFRADRPFLYLVIAPSARVLFVGVMANPSA
jgi:serpin B